MEEAEEGGAVVRRLKGSCKLLPPSPPVFRPSEFRPLCCGYPCMIIESPGKFVLLLQDMNFLAAECLSQEIVSGLKT